MVIDTHSQLWTKEALATVPERMVRGYEKMFKGVRTFELEDILLDMDQAGVDKAVLVAVDAETVWRYRVPNELVADAVRRYPDRFIGFAGVDPNKGILAVDELSRSVEVLGLSGVKFIPHLINMTPNDPRMYPILEKAQEFGLPVLIHTGTHFHNGARLKFCRPDTLDDLAIDFPELKIIAAHFGFPWFYEALAVVQKNANVYFNIAGWAPRYIPEYVVRMMNGPLAGKALLGSDFPLISRTRLMRELKEIEISADTFGKLTHENPAKVLGLPSHSNK